MAPENASIENLISECLNGSWQHKEVLYKNYYGYIKGVIVRYISNFHEAEELINDSFLKIFNNLSNFNASDQATEISYSFKSWIARIASRTAIDFLRKQNPGYRTDEINENHVPNPQSLGEYINDAKDILNMLNSLPEAHRTVFNLYVIEGFTHEEIADLLTIPENVSRVYLSRAKNKLKSLYVKNF